MLYHPPRIPGAGLAVAWPAGRPRPVDLAGAVSASMIAEQAVCEYRVHLRLKAGGSRAKAKVGSNDVGELVSLITGIPRETYRGEALGVPVVARPHAVLRVNGATVIVRARLGGDLRPSPYDRAYLEAAGIAVGVEEAVLALAAARSVEGLRAALEHVKRDPRPAAGGDWAVSTWLFQRGEVIGRLSRLLEYWLGLRRPQPSPSTGRCASCPYASECPHSAARDPGVG